MAYTYTPMYYSSFQETITSLCKSLLPFSSKNRHLHADRKLSKLHAENLRWQQESYHRILNLIGLYKEGIVSIAEVSEFRSRLLKTLIASPAEQEPSAIIRDKLLFLQELLYAKCISANEYHSSKSPLLQRLADLGVEIDGKDVIIGVPPLLKNSEDEWTDIDLTDGEPAKVAEKCKGKTPLKLLWRGKVRKDGSNAKENEGSRDMKSMELSQGSQLMNAKRKPFHALFHREKEDEESENRNDVHESKKRVEKSSKNQWGFESLKKWKRTDDSSRINQSTAKMIEKKIHFNGCDPEFVTDKDLGENIKKELCRIKTELSSTKQNLNFSEDQIEAISMKLPVNKADLNKFFPKSWCNTNGDIVLEVVKEEFKDHVGEIQNLKNDSMEERNDFDENWVAFEDDNGSFHPNLFTRVPLSSNRQVNDLNAYNPFR